LLLTVTAKATTLTKFLYD